MVLLLSLVFYTWGPSVAAHPPGVTLLKSRDAPTSEQFDTNYRSTTDILWTCLLTIFACTWVSVHPNVAGYQSTWRQTFTARLELMLWAVFAPELIVVFAFRQWGGARAIERRMNELARSQGAGKDIMPWTETRAHLLQMGGFIIREKDGRCRYLDITWLLEGREVTSTLMFSSSTISFHSLSQQLDREGRPVVPNPVPDDLGAEREGRPFVPNSVPDGLGADSELPRDLMTLLSINVPESDIWDKSKGDAFGKGLALTQTTWFLVQILARFALRMDVTHLEVTTLAYAALNGVIYWFWWKKPLDVQCPFIIDDHLGARQESGSPFKSTRVNLPAPPEAVHLSSPKNNASTTSVLSVLSGPARSRTFWAREAPMILVRTLKRGINRLRTVVEYRRGNPENQVETRSTRFPMFYALELSTNYPFNRPAPRAILASNHSATQLMGLALASAFGAIHCIAWNLQFDRASPTPLPLGKLWRVSSLCIAASPAPLALVFVTAFLHQWPKGQPLFRLERSIWWKCIGWLKVVGQAVVFLYIPARLILIVLAFYDLGSLTPSAHRTVEWASFVPHFG